MKLQDYILAHLPLVLLGSKLAVLWVLANYTYPADPDPGAARNNWRSHAGRRWHEVIAARSIILACAVFSISGWSYTLPVFTLACAVFQPLVRLRIPTRFLAEFEVVSNSIFLLGAVGIALLKNLPAVLPAESVPASCQMAACLLIMAIVVFAMRGGSNMVRGILDKGKIYPVEAHPSRDPAGAHTGKKAQSDSSRHGRIIGIIERLMLMTFIAMQAYDALAFLLTAKGLFRAQEFEKKDFADYFLVGTLASSMIAIAAGLAIQFVLKLLW